MPARALPTELALESSIGREPLALVGPGSRGGVYRSLRQPFFFRVVPIAQAPLTFRHEVAGAMALPRRAGIAPVVEAAHDVDSGFYFIRYEIAGDTTLPEALASPDPRQRLVSCARTLGALPGWWRALGHAVLPMPADIVMGSDGTPHLLPWHAQHMPDPQTIFDCPARGIYLAPEIVRGLSASASESADRYVTGVMLLQCFFRLAEGSGDVVLLQAATGSLLARDRLASLLPSWMERLPATQEAVAVARRLVDPDADARGRLDPSALAAQLLECARQMDALTAVGSLRAAGRSRDALALLGDVLLAQETPELLVLAGTLAEEDLGTPLQAIDFFERAIALDPVRRDASEGQLRALTALATAGAPGELHLLCNGTPGIGEKLDAMLWRDLQRLPGETQATHAESVASYLLERRQFAPAHAFLYPHLFQGDTWLWWKSALNLAFVAALVGQDRLDEARRHLEEIKQRFRRARENRSMPEAEIHAYGQAVAEMEAEILKRRQRARGCQ
jgi:hypothetical protein